MTDPHGLYQLLAFADAVGSNGAILDVCLCNVGSLCFTAELGTGIVEDRTGINYTVTTDGTCYAFDYEAETGRRCLQRYTPTSFQDTPYDAHGEEFARQVAAQLEPLLFMAHRLQLQPLISRLHRFIASCTYDAHGLLRGELALQTVFSPRVLDEALGSSSMTEDAWISSILAQPYSLGADVDGHTQRRLLEPLGPRPDPVSFKARLVEDFAGSHKGDEVTVRLDLFGEEVADDDDDFSAFRYSKPHLKVGNVYVPVQLLLGGGVPVTKGSS